MVQFEQLSVLFSRSSIGDKSMTIQVMVILKRNTDIKISAPYDISFIVRVKIYDQSIVDPLHLRHKCNFEILVVIKSVEQTGTK